MSTGNAEQTPRANGPEDASLEEQMSTVVLYDKDGNLVHKGSTIPPEYIEEPQVLGIATGERYIEEYPN